MLNGAAGVIVKAGLELVSAVMLSDVLPVLKTVSGRVAKPAATEPKLSDAVETAILGLPLVGPPLPATET